MARIRTIKPEFWTDEDIASLSEPARLLAIGLLNQADDEGYFKSHPLLLKAAVFPLTEPSVNIHDMIIELTNIGYIACYKGSDGKQYGCVCSFLNHQKINRPSPSKIKDLIDFSEHSVSIHEPITVGKEQGTGKGKEQGTGKGTFERPSIDDVIKYMTERQWTNPESDANRWMDYFLTNGFKVTKAKTPMKDWKAAVRNWEKDGSFKKPDYSNIPCQEIANEYDRILKPIMMVSANPLTDRNKSDITKAWNGSGDCQSVEWWSQIFNAIREKLEPVDQQYRAARYTFDKLVGFEFMTVIKEFI